MKKIIVLLLLFPLAINAQYAVADFIKNEMVWSPITINWKKSGELVMKIP